MLIHSFTIYEIQILREYLYEIIIATYHSLRLRARMKVPLATSVNEVMGL